MKYTPPYTRSKTMEELKEKIEEMEDIKSLVVNQEGLKEKMQINNTLLKNDLVLVIERRLDDKLDILTKNKKTWMTK